MNKKIFATIASLLFSASTYAADVNLSTTPLFLGGQAAPLVMLVMGRDHTLYYEAYNDATDLDGNGVIDEYETRYAPKTTSSYYGIFDSNLCYDYDFSDNYFNPVAKSNADKSCTGSHWSGDFLNYLTTARIDAVRKVLYGGQRDIDTATNTRLRRTQLPHDAHSWGKVYSNDMATKSSYPFDLSKYSPLPTITDNEQIFFANTSMSYSFNNGNGNTSVTTTDPLLRILILPKKNNSNNDIRIWNWLSKEQPVADNYILDYDYLSVNPGSSFASANSKSIKDIYVRVKSCVAVSGYYSPECKQYNGSYKPEGLLQKYSDSMLFGLLTGSYSKNKQGGVVRKQISSLSDEIDSSTGQFNFNKTATTVPAVIRNIDKLVVAKFDYTNRNYSDCGWITTRMMNNGECHDWGSPLAEMLYESVRYFSGVLQPTPKFQYTESNSVDAGLGLNEVTTWADPFTASGAGVCSKPVDLIINSLTPNFDSDQIPGANSKFIDGGYTDNGQNGTLYSGLTFNATSSTDTISSHEGINGHSYFIGDDGTSTALNAPTAKSVSSLSAVRGLSPEGPGQQGSFYSAGVAYFAHINDIHKNNATDNGVQNLTTHVVGLSSPLPQIKINVGGHIVTMVPVAKSVGGSSISATEGDFQPTNQIVDYYVETLGATSGSFIVNFEDVEQGADHDMDLIVRYEYSVTNGVLTLTTKSTYAAGGIIQHAGYVISGTGNDGLYLDVGDESAGPNDVKYYLDTPSTTDYLPRKALITGNKAGKDAYVPFQTDVIRTFSTSGAAANFLPSPLWYTAKWGGFTDTNATGHTTNIPDAGEWDSLVSGQPDNYYPVTNMSNLPTLLGQAFANIAAGTKTTTALAYSSPTITTASTVYAYKTSFNSGDWTGDLKAFSIDSSGALAANATWSASAQLDAATVADRKIFTYYKNGATVNKVNFSAPTTVSGSATTLSAAQITTLLSDAGLTSSDTNIQKLVNYLRGDKTNEGTNSGQLRVRNHRLGDIVDSTPVSGTSIDGVKFALVGANDGMVHIFNADTGDEIFAYMPSIPTAVNSYHPSAAALAKQTYSHQFYVNGGISLSKVTSGGTTKLIAIGTLGQGGQTVYALDLTNLSAPSATANLLWEYTDPELGYTGGTPSIVTLKDGTKAVIFGNGYNNTQADGSPSATGNASVFVVNALTGVLIQRLDTKVGKTVDPLGKLRANAMAQPVVLADSTSTRTAKAIYAGDLFGNLWKWNIDDVSSANWLPAVGTAAAPSPTFIAKDASGNIQPITTKPSLAMHASGNGVMVLFGTGKYIESTDNTYDLPTNATPTSFEVQSFYGIRDYKDNVSVTSLIARSSLQPRVITAEIKIGNSYKRLIDTSSDMTTTPAAIDWGAKKGWYLDLSNSQAEILGSAAAKSVNGERSVTNSSVSLQKLTFTTLIPGTDVCAGTNSGWLMELNASEGTLYVPLSAEVDTSQESTISYLTSLKSTGGVLSSPSNVYSNDGSSTKQLTQVTTSAGDVLTSDGEPIASKQESWKQVY